MERTKIESSNIASIGHDEESRTLEVEFNNGSIYHYHPVSKSGYVELIKADSVGSYFWKNIRNNDNITTTPVG